LPNHYKLLPLNIINHIVYNFCINLIMKKLISFTAAFLIAFTLSAEIFQKNSSRVNEPETLFDEIKTHQNQLSILTKTDIPKLKESQTSYFENIINMPKLNKKLGEENELTLDSVIIERIDSTGILQLDSKKINFYDKNGYDSLRVVYRRNMHENKWVIDQREEYSYDESENKLHEILYQWDTSASKWYGVYKYENDYDSKGNEILNSSYHWDSAINDWAGDEKYIYEFNSDKDETMRCSFAWDTLSNDWIGSSKVEITYFAPREQLSRKIYRWDNNQWSLSSKTEFSYNEDTLLTLALSYEFDDSSQQLINSWKEEMTYDSLGFISSMKSYAWNGEWLIRQSDEYAHTIYGDQTLYIKSKWDSETQKLVYDSKEETEYDETGERTFNAYYTWDDNSSTWICYDKTTSSYNPETGITAYIIYDKNESDSLVAAGRYEIKYDSLDRMTMMSIFMADSTGGFYPYMKEDLGYDEFGNVNFTTLYALDDSTGEFVLLYKIDAVFIAINEEISMIAQMRDEITGELHPYTKRETIWETPLKEIFINYVWDSESNELVMNLRNTYYYSEERPTGTETNFVRKNVRVYPNPASDIVTFDLKDVSPARIEMFNLHGAKVISKDLSNTKQLFINHLNKGMYIYHILQNGKTYQGKIMVE